jgi:C_GCAxxG_C_C family probable redox protein
MSAKEEKAREFFSNDYNCAQAVLGTFCEDDGLDIKTAFKLSNGFGSGVRCGEICGAVSGAIMAIGLKCGFYIEKDVKQEDFCNKKAFEFLEKFKEANGSLLCRDLLGLDIHSPEDHNTPEAKELHKTLCPKMVTSAVLILESMEFGSVMNMEQNS